MIWFLSIDSIETFLNCTLFLYLFYVFEFFEMPKIWFFEFWGVIWTLTTCDVEDEVFAEIVENWELVEKSIVVCEEEGHIDDFLFTSFKQYLLILIHKTPKLINNLTLLIQLKTLLNMHILDLNQPFHIRIQQCLCRS